MDEGMDRSLFLTLRQGVAIYSHGVSAGPFTSGGLVLDSVILVQVGDVGDKWVVGVGIGQQGADGEEHLGDSERG